MSDNSARKPHTVQISRTALIVVIVAVVFGVAGITLAIVALAAPQVGIALFVTETPTPSPTPVPTATPWPTAAPSVEEIYVNSSMQMLADIEAFSSSVSDLNRAFNAGAFPLYYFPLIASTLDENGDEKLSANDVLVLREVYLTSGEPYPDSEWLSMLREQLTGPMMRVDEEALQVLSTLEGILPPPDVASHHRQVVRCANAQVERVEAIRLMLRGRTVSVVWNSSACDRLSRSVREIEKYIDAVSSEERHSQLLPSSMTQSLSLP